MKKQILPVFIILLLISVSIPSHGNSLNEIVLTGSLDDINTDTIEGRISFAIIKINPFQIILSEIPVSFEYDLPHERSLQFQIGYIFPYIKESVFMKLFESSGRNGDATSEGLFSYRKSPFNNNGLSFKLEYRKYGKNLYYASQLMYKYCFYKKTTFPVFGGGVTLNQTESKYSNIFGLGFIMGKQYDKGDYVLDWYGGIGLRLRSMSVTILEIQNPAYTTYTVYPNTQENITSFYPFINFGLRIGIRLWKDILL